MYFITVIPKDCKKALARATKSNVVKGVLFDVIGRGSGLLAALVSQVFYCWLLLQKMGNTYSVCPCKSCRWSERLTPFCDDMLQNSQSFQLTFDLTIWHVKKWQLPIADQAAKPNISGRREQSERPKTLNLSFKHRASFTVCKQKNPQWPQKWRFP